VDGDWRAALPEEIREDPSLKVYKTLGELAKGHIQTKAMVGKPLTPPDDKATPDELAAYRTRLGIPAEATPAAYGVTPSDALHAPDVESFVKTMHAAGATPKVVQAAAAFYTGYLLKQKDQGTAQQAREEQAALDAAFTELEKTWGPRDGPTWKRSVALAEEGVRQMLEDEPPEVIEAVIVQANDPLLLRAWAKIGESLVGKGFVETSAIPGGVTAEDARQQIAEMAAAADTDPKHPLHHLDRYPETERRWLHLHGIVARANQTAAA
jgi:hypothetical protein